MTKHLLPLAILLLAPVFTHAQARPDCALKPASLTQMRLCYRPLLVFSPSATDARLVKQQSALDEAADDMMDRFVMLTPVLSATRGFQAPLDTPYVVLSAQEMRTIRRRFQIPANRFAVLLLGEDGSIALRSNQPVEAARLNALIDTMPVRKVEEERPHAN